MLPRIRSSFLDPRPFLLEWSLQAAKSTDFDREALPLCASATSVAIRMGGDQFRKKSTDFDREALPSPCEQKLQ